MTVAVDTNIVIYAQSTDPRGNRARQLLAEEPVIAVQTLNEFTLFARRRLGWDWPRITTALATVRLLCATPQPLTLEVHALGLGLAERYQLGIYDSMIVAAALAAGCDILWSEDMHDGLVVDDRLTIRNPF